MEAREPTSAEGAKLHAADKAAASEAGRALGSVKTPKKTESSRARILALKAEGITGGRPKGTPQSEETKAKISAARRRNVEAKKAAAIQVQQAG